MRPLVLLLLLPTAAAALEPRDVLVVSNKAEPGSRGVADHYLAARKVPRENLVELDLPTGEDISRDDYNRKLAGPLRAAVRSRKERPKVLLLVYGVPLRVGGPSQTAEEKKEVADLAPKIDAARKKLTELTDAKPQDKDATDAANRDLSALVARRQSLSHAESTASVDSELMLLLWPDYPLPRFVPNPLYWQISDAKRSLAPPTLMTARLDGPTPAIAKGLVDQAVKVEAEGLKGKAVIDARGIKFDPSKKGEAGTGYEAYDESFREAAALLKKVGMDVSLDDKGELLPPGSGKEVALYAGWYSHARFIDSNEFVPGAVAWHLASSEATTLRHDRSAVWCPNLLKKGVAATLGPVAEPYTIGFPKPAEFFGFLATGRYTLVECYARTVYFASWMGVLVGDPLYNPYRTNPLLKETEVASSPAGVPAVIR